MSKFESKFTRDDAFAFILDVVGDDMGTKALIEAIKNKTISPDSFIAELDADASLMQLIIECLAFSGRVVRLDWREPIRDCVNEFSRLLTRVGIAVEAAERSLKDVAFSSRGEGPGMAYVAYRPLAEAKDMRVIDLYNGTDDYWLVIVPRAIAERWEWVVVAEHQYFCDADFQFSHALRKAKIEPHYGKAPPEARQPPSAA
ncbi:hypothetical protein [Rhizobium sp. MHM7A]|uniref:DUF6630 family protein n=1 Tax=Rhizobium sp. MHM7A TaxID=2583233 RepID=UPI001106201D|nr:hypothetical protein [Rhizobium sp. MHM7A]TLX15939.1 hypothetical protein FFR93_01080 [Rhizobium sp. MHM7A]